MALTHNGQEFKGLFSNPRVTPVEHFTTRTHFQGVHGISEIDGGRGSRSIGVNLWHFYSYSTEAALKSGLDLLNKLVGANGDLVFDGNLDETYKDVTFEGWELVFGPLRDVANLLDGGWWAEIELFFTQLSVEEG